MDLYEQLVEVYLTVFEGSFVLPQPPVKLGAGDAPVGLFEGGSQWDAFPDFIALNFRKGQIQIVEVSKTTSLAELKGKLEKYRDKHYETWIRQILAPNLAQLPITRRLFVRKTLVDRLGSVDSELIPLEQVFDTIRDKMP